jgi:branched-chain amino acid transport system substrate-binding protein
LKLKRVLVFSAIAAFCLTSGMTAQAQEKTPLKVGAVFSVTGKASTLGVPEKNTVVLIAETINRTGGLNGYPLQIMVEDDQSLESGAVEAVTRLIEHEKVLAIIGPSTSGNSLAVKAICEKARVPMVSCAAAEAIVTPPEASRFIFKTPQLDSHVAMRILEQIKAMGITKIAVLSESTPFGKQGRMHLQNEAPAYGLQIVADETFATNATDMTPQVKKAMEAGAQAVVNWSVVPTQTIVPRNMKKVGFHVPLFHSHGFANPKYIEQAKDACEGIVFPSGRMLVADLLPDNHYQKKILTSYKTQYEKSFGTVSPFGGYAYDALWMVMNAMTAKQIRPNMDLASARSLIRDGLEATKDWVGTSGVFTMSPTDHTGLDKDKSLELLTVKNGEVVPLPLGFARGTEGHQ